MRFVPPPEATQGVDSPYLGPVTHIVLGPYEGGSLDWTGLSGMGKHLLTRWQVHGCESFASWLWLLKWQVGGGAGGGGGKENNLCASHRTIQRGRCTHRTLL
jgi:hypothetical protein